MFAFAQTSIDELVYFEFGDPLDPEIPIEAQVRWILADFESRKDTFIVLSRSHSVALMIEWLSEARGDSGALMNLIRAIGFLRFTGSAPAIESYLADASTQVRAETVLALGRIGALDSLPKIEPFLDSPDTVLRRAAIVALSRSLNPAEFEKLDTSAGANPELRQIVRQGRRRLATVEAADLKAFTDVVLETEEFEDLIPMVEFTWEFIVDNLRDPQRDPIVRRRALSLIRTVRMRRAGPALGAILADVSELPDMRLEAAIAAGPCKAEEAVNPLIGMVNSEPSLVREIAVTSLGQIGSAKALDPLLASWRRGDTSKAMIRLAIRRLCKVHGPPVVIDLLRTNQPWAHREVYFITTDLRLIEGYSAGLLDSELRSPNAMARRDAILLITYLGDRAERAKFAMLADDPDPSVRDLARRASAATITGPPI